MAKFKYTLVVDSYRHAAGRSNVRIVIHKGLRVLRAITLGPTAKWERPYTSVGKTLKYWVSTNLSFKVDVARSITKEKARIIVTTLRTH